MIIIIIIIISCFSEIQLAGQKYRDKATLASKTPFQLSLFLVFKAGAIRY